VALQWLRAIPSAWQEIVHENPTPIVREMMKHAALLESRAYVSETEYDDMLSAEAIRVNLLAPKAKGNVALHGFRRFLRGLDKFGQFEEHVAKVAGYRELMRLRDAGKLNLTVEQIAARTRERVGTPDPMRRGALSTWYNSIWMFSNIKKEALRGHLEAFREHPALYSWKMLEYVIVPKLVLYAASVGLLGDLLKRIVDRMPERDKANALVIPLGLSADDKAIYLRLPQDDVPGIIGAMFWKTLRIAEEQATGKPVAGAEPSEVIGAMTREIPWTPSGFHPVIKAAWAAIQYASGTNPYDDWYDRRMVSDAAFEAGGIRSHKEFAKHITQMLGPRVLMQFDAKTPREAGNAIDRVFGVPVLGPTARSVLAVSNRGILEEAEAATQPIAQERRTRSLDLEDFVQDRLRAAGGKPTNADAGRAFLDARKQGLLAPDATMAQFMSRWRRQAVRSNLNVYVRAVADAATNDAKAALLVKYERDLEGAEFRSLLRTLVTERHVSADALGKWRRMKAAREQERNRD
jgi:hypothetical protein